MTLRWQKRVGFLFVFTGLMMFGAFAEAGHESTSQGDILTFEPDLLQSHSSKMSVQTGAAGACTVSAAKELFITDVSVVDDCYRTTWEGSCPGAPVAPATRGAWTFGRAMEGVFGTTDPQKLSNRVRQWLTTWMDDHVVNGDLVAARPNVRNLILRPWEKASGGPGNRLDMKKAPFRLLAIVNQQFVSQTFEDAGQFRLIYNLLDANGNPTDFNVILEYQIPGSSCPETFSYTYAFHALSGMSFGEAYNAHLQSISDRIMTIGATPGALNGSSLKSLRTNEAFLGSPWEMRGFSLAKEDDDEDEGEEEEGTKNAKLALQPLDLTPAERLQGTQTLADFITEFAPQILAVDAPRVLPLTYRGEPFLGGVAHNSLTLGWGGPDPICSTAPKAARRTFSFRTCQGCHGKDTATNFVHVKGRLAGQPAQLSKFLTGPTYTVRDACTALTVNELFLRTFHQCFLLNQTCPSTPAAPPASSRKK